MTRSALILCLALSACSTKQPEGIETIPQAVEMGAYLAAKRTILVKPDYRQDFQSCADTLGVLIDDWGNMDAPRPITMKQLQQTLACLPVSEMRSSGGALIVRKDDVLFNYEPLAREMILPVAVAVRAGLERFLEHDDH